MFRLVGYLCARRDVSGNAIVYSLHIRLFVSLFAAAWGVVFSANGAIVERSISSSRQFIVFGNDAKLRAGLCGLAEQTKKNFCAILQHRDNWKTPIVIYAQRLAASDPPSAPARLHFSQTGFGLKLQLNLAVANDARPDRIERELLHALLLELIYRNAPNTSAGTAYTQPPDWLIEGVLALSPERDSAALAASVAQLPVLGMSQPLTEFLEQKTELLDAPSRIVFSAKAAALVSMLTESPEAASRFWRFIAALSTATESAGTLLTRFFPAASDTTEFEQRWSSALQRLATRDRFQMLNCEQTEKALADLLTIRIPNSVKSIADCRLEEFPRFLRSAGAPAALRELQGRLSLFAARANPLFGPIIIEYERIVLLLARRKTHRIPEQLARLRGDREEIRRRMSAIDDYINWFEATQIRAASGAFSDYLRAAEIATEKQPQRHDAISVYLDAMESQVQP